MTEGAPVDHQVWLENIGEIMVSEDGEFFWMLPEIFVSVYDCCVSSPYFSFDKENWRLVIMPSNGTGPVLMNGDYIGLFLWLKGCSVPKQNYTVRLAIKTTEEYDKNSVSGKLGDNYGFGKWDFLLLKRPDDDYTFPNDECRYLQDIMLDSGLINFSCKIERHEDDSLDLFLSAESENEENENETEDEGDEKQKKNSESKSTESEDKKYENETDYEEYEKLQNESEYKGVDRLTQNLGKLLHSEWSSDVILKTNDHEFHGHRIILWTRSPVFSSMFQHDMAEKNTGEVDVSDCSTEGFKVFLEYLYTGKADMSPANAVDLYYIADKYQVVDLKSDCVECMKNNLSIDNFCDVIALSIRHSESDLESFANRFFCRNIKKIVKTVQWQKYITENPIQGNELFINAINA